MVALLAAVVVAVGPSRRSGATPVAPDGPAVQAAERDRRVEGAPRLDVDLRAAPVTLSLGGRSVTTWAFNGSVPAPTIRLGAGGVLRARVRNDLPAPLTIHWHGIALRNDMDGVPDVTQAPIAPGAEYVYEFTAPDPGTYFYHPHTGTQLDRGLYGSLVVDDPAEPAVAERDYTLLLDDWIDGFDTDPDRVLERLQAGGARMDETSEPSSGMGHDMTMGAEMDEENQERQAGIEEGPLGDDTGDVDYPLYLVNGHAPADPPVFDAKPGERVRLRLVNAGSDTPFRVAVADSRLSVVAADGFPVAPVTVDAVLLGMGERYDAVVTIPATGGVLPVVAAAEGKAGGALAVLRAGPGPLPAPDVRPAELTGRLLALSDLRPAAGVALPPGQPERTYVVPLTGDMARYRWGIPAPKADGVTLPVRRGERIRLVVENQTMMWHPIHLHGHTFEVAGDGAAPGARKDTVVIPAMGTVTVEFVADNPGQWALHCHNIYHAEAGMVTVVTYVE
jgi:FtsP/CotA-like multicopper oxidase with cupredoxin domain